MCKGRELEMGIACLERKEVLSGGEWDWRAAGPSLEGLCLEKDSIDLCLVY